MTREEFAQTRFTANMKAEYKGHIYNVISVNFEEGLFGLFDSEIDFDGNDDLFWVRCESVKLVTS